MQLRRVIDVYVQPRIEALNTVSRQVNRILKHVKNARAGCASPSAERSKA